MDLPWISPETAKEAMALIDEFESSAKTEREEALILAAFMECISICETKRGSETNEQLYSDGMLKRLYGQPTDCVIVALRIWPDKSKWRPMWADIKTVIDDVNETRNKWRIGLYCSAGGYKSKLKLKAA